MTIFQGYDGELRLYSYGNVYGTDPSGTTFYLEVLFCEMDFSGPLSRGKAEERLILDRGRYDSNAHYVKGDDLPIYSPVQFSFSARLADTVNTRVLSDWVSGVTALVNAASATTIIYSWMGHTTLQGSTAPQFSDESKYRYRVDMKWDGTNDYGVRYEEVYFPPEQQTISESADGLILNATGMIYGDVTRISAFYSGTSILAFS